MKRFIAVLLSSFVCSSCTKPAKYDVVIRHGPWLSREVFVAGPAVMVDDTVSRLLQQGIPRTRIRSEVFAPSRMGPSLDGEVTE